MTPKEKAKELVDKMYDVMDIQDGDLWKSTKQCALIAVDEILNMKIIRKDELLDDYWEDVKHEIEKL